MVLYSKHVQRQKWYYCYYYNCSMAPCTLSRTTRVSQYQKGKTNLDLLEQETVSGSGISWAKCNKRNICYS